jgi:hypothetical protein
MTRTRHSSKRESRLLNRRNLRLCGTTLTAAYLLCALEAMSLAPADHRHAGLTRGHHDDRWKVPSAAATEVRR